MEEEINKIDKGIAIPFVVYSGGSKLKSNKN